MAKRTKKRVDALEDTYALTMLKAMDKCIDDLRIDKCLELIDEWHQTIIEQTTPKRRGRPPKNRSK